MASRRIQQSIRALLLVLALLPFSVAHAAETWSKLGDTPGFPGLRAVLKQEVRERGRTSGDFCVVLWRQGSDQILYTLWHQKHLLYQWGATNEPQMTEQVLIGFEPLDLRRDIIRTAQDRTSTYKVTRQWVRNLERQCREHGEQIRIVP